MQNNNISRHNVKSTLEYNTSRNHSVYDEPMIYSDYDIKMLLERYDRMERLLSHLRQNASRSSDKNTIVGIAALNHSLKIEPLDELRDTIDLECGHCAYNPCRCK